MHRLTLRLIAALLTFAIGVSAAALWFVLRQPSQEMIEVDRSHVISVSVNQERAVKSGIAGSGTSEDGFPMSFSNHEYSDGTSINQMSVFYNSSKRANRELQKRLKRAVEIVERKPFLNENGRRTGEQVVATFAPYKGSSSVWAELFWTDGSRFVSQRHSSLESVLELANASNR